MKNSQEFRHICLSEYADLLANGYFRAYSGVPPASVADAPGTLLVECPLPATPFGAPASGSMNPLGIPWFGVAVATGTVAYGRFFKADGTSVVTQVTASAAGGGGEATLSSLAAVSGEPMAITGYTVNNPE